MGGGYICITIVHLHGETGDLAGLGWAGLGERRRFFAGRCGFSCVGEGEEGGDRRRGEGVLIDGVCFRGGVLGGGGDVEGQTRDVRVLFQELNRSFVCMCGHICVD